jgi:hypothetical protein
MLYTPNKFAKAARKLIHYLWTVAKSIPSYTPLEYKKLNPAQFHILVLDHNHWMHHHRNIQLKYDCSDDHTTNINSPNATTQQTIFEYLNNRHDILGYHHHPNSQRFNISVFGESNFEIIQKSIHEALATNPFPYHIEVRRLKQPNKYKTHSENASNSSSIATISSQYDDILSARVSAASHKTYDDTSTIPSTNSAWTRQPKILITPTKLPNTNYST